MRFRLAHPSEPRTWAWYGHDRTGLGFWAEVRRGGRLVDAYDGLRSGQTTIQGVLSRLTEHGFIDEDDIHEAMRQLAIMDAADIEDPNVRRAATVIEQLRQAAAEG